MPIGNNPPHPPLGRNLTWGLLDHLGKAIVTGAYEQTPFPTEAELSLQHGISRSVTREAVKMLTAKGLLSARPRQGTMVQPSANWNLFDPDVLSWLLERKLTIELLLQFSQLRSAIEPAAAALAAQYATPGAIDAIRAGHHLMIEAEAANGDPLEADIAFHIAILSASGNPFFAQFRDVVATALRTSIKFTNRIKGRTADIGEHEAVLLAIEAGDPDAARQAMDRIISDVATLIDLETTGDETGQGDHPPKP